jgi:hypothetical protein
MTIRNDSNIEGGHILIDWAGSVNGTLKTISKMPIQAL